MADVANGKVPESAALAISLYCSHCSVIEECRNLGNETQSTGVFGGQYRDLVNKARTYRVHGVRSEPYRSGVHVPGDTLDGPQPAPNGSVARDEAMALLGIGFKQTLEKACVRYGVVPLMKGGGARPSYYALSDIEYIKQRREENK